MPKENRPKSSTSSSYRSTFTSDDPSKLSNLRTKVRKDGKERVFSRIAQNPRAFLDQTNDRQEVPKSFITAAKILNHINSGKASYEWLATGYKQVIQQLEKVSSVHGTGEDLSNREINQQKLEAFSGLVYHLARRNELENLDELASYLGEAIKAWKRRKFENVLWDNHLAKVSLVKAFC